MWHIRIIRYTAVYLFLWFGIQQLVDPGAWLGFLPEWTGYFPVPGEMLVRLNGWFEIICAIALLGGFYTRVISLILGVHLVFIGLSLSGPTAIRDTALGLFVLSLAFANPDDWTVDALVHKKAT